MKLIQILVYPIYILAFLRVVRGKASYERAKRRNELIRKALTDLYYRRAKRFEEALAPRMLDAPVLMDEANVFDGWVKLCDSDGTIVVGGQTLDPQKDAFEVNARDERNIARATVVSNGQGMVFITSHGMNFCARWENSKWEVRPLPDQRSLSQGE